MQFQFKGFKATRPVARICNPKTIQYEVFFLIYVGGEKLPMRYRKDINKAKARGQRKLQAEAMADVLWEALTSGWNPLQERYPAFESELRQQRKMGFNEAIDYCFAEKKKILATGSIYNYRYTVKVIKKAATACGFSTAKVNTMQRRDLRTILEQARDDSNWSSKYRNQNLDNLKSLLSVLVDKDIIEHNPALKIKQERQPERVSYKRITESERQLIAETLTIKAPDYLGFLVFVYDTGIRPKELHFIQLFDISLIRREIKVREEVAKTNRERVIPITDDMLGFLVDKNISTLPRDWYLFSKNGFAPGPEPYWPRAAARWWKKLIQQGLEIDAKLYGLKHSGADAKLLAGIDTRTLKSLYGHSSEQMTEKYLEELQEIHKQKIIANAPSFSAKVIPMKKAE